MSQGKKEPKINPTSWRTRIQSSKREGEAYRKSETQARIPCLSTRRIPIETRVKMVEYYSKYDTIPEMQRAWEKDIGGKPPGRTSFILINKKFDETGSVHDLYRPNNSATVKCQKRSAEVIDQVLEILKQDPHRTLTGVADELGMSRQGLFKIRRQTNFIPNKHFTWRGVAHLKSKLQGLKVKYGILKRKQRNADRKLKKPYQPKPRRERCRVPKTSAKSVKAKISRFEYPQEGPDFEADEVQLEPRTLEEEDISSDSDSSSSSSSSSESDETTRDIE